MTSFKIFCFIPAKGTSTRLKKKNILKLGGKELIAYAISAAQDSALFGDDIIVSTESEEIGEIALKYKAKVPFYRDSHLSEDPYGVSDVLLDFFSKDTAYSCYASVCIILPTCPFVSKSDIQGSYDVFAKKNAKALMSVTETDHNALRSVVIEEDLLVPIFPDSIRKKSQELSPTYRINGAIIWLDIQEFRKQKTYFMDTISCYEMPRSRSIDIDTYDDYLQAQFIMEK